MAIFPEENIRQFKRKIVYIFVLLIKVAIAKKRETESVYYCLKTDKSFVKIKDNQLYL